MSTIEEQLNKLREETLASLKKSRLKMKKKCKIYEFLFLGKRLFNRDFKRNERRLCRYASDYREACQ